VRSADVVRPAAHVMIGAGIVEKAQQGGSGYRHGERQGIPYSVERRAFAMIRKLKDGR
jgi:hypothetical protein